ncbi:MAG: AarF/ABC1/UbiB kinase family protein [Myxococcales bacterium]|nr:AarF/ABC1/UbiB kinase family protein [Myxococcales bacterium]
MSTVSRVYTSVRGLSTAIKDAGRLQEIARVLARHGFGALVTRMNLADAGAIGDVREPDAHAPYSTPQRVRIAIEELGPTFIKLGQILSTRSDLVPADVLAELQLLQDTVPPMAWEDVEAQIREQLDDDVDTLFEQFDREPLACASIAQVHRAVLRSSGTPVVVKVQRRSISAAIESDLNILHFLARRAEAAVPELQLMDPVGIVREFDKALRKELDFRNEAFNLRKFAANFAGFEGLVVPKVFDEVSTSRVLVMEFISGVKITTAPRVLSVDPYVVAPRMLRALFKMIFQDGFFHGDLHPGNILIQQDGTIGLIDFGLVGRLTESQRDHILDIIVSMVREDYESLARVFFDVGVKLPGVRYDYPAFEADVIEVMQRHLEGRTLNEIDVGGYFADLVAGAIRHRIKMPPTYTMVFKALMTVEGIGKTLAPDLNLLEEARPFATEMLAERYSAKRLTKLGVDTLGAFSSFLRQFPLTATQVLRDAQEGNLHFKIELDGFSELLAHDRRYRTRQARATVGAGAAIAGAIALQAGPGPILGLNIPAAVLFGVAAALASPFVLSSLRRS